MTAEPCVHHWLIGADGTYEEVMEYNARGWMRFYRRIDRAVCQRCGATATFDNRARSERAPVAVVGNRAHDGVRKAPRKAGAVQQKEAMDCCQKNQQPSLFELPMDVGE